MKRVESAAAALPDRTRVPIESTTPDVANTTGRRKEVADRHREKIRQKRSTPHRPQQRRRHRARRQRPTILRRPPHRPPTTITTTTTKVESLHVPIAAKSSMPTTI